MSNAQEENCRFCQPPDSDRIILQTRNFYVMLSLGPIFEGYSLIITREHIECCAAIPESILPEFMGLVQTVQISQHKVYGASLYYEHGRTGSCLPDARGEPHCHHAHLHCVPTTFALARHVAERYPVNFLDSWYTLAAEYRKTNESYLLIQASEQLAHAPVPEKIPRQFLRTALAESIAESHLADWGAFQGWELIDKAKMRLEPVMRQVAYELNLPLTIT